VAELAVSLVIVELLVIVESIGVVTTGDMVSPVTDESTGPAESSGAMVSSTESTGSSTESTEGMEVSTSSSSLPQAETRRRPLSAATPKSARRIGGFLSGVFTPPAPLVPRRSVADT